ncbi:MAG: tetratricopeptide repeat protein, partial [Alphaproteobacteria bacterium]|nr:tetratricopeptide repeat protein [Alphaproteobacteria bacterium]
MRRLVVAGVVLLAMAVAAVAARADVASGLRAFEAADYRIALRELGPAAEAGDVRAQFHLGLMYDAGLGVEADPLEAALWMAKAATKDHDEAQRVLGIFYEEGKGVLKDYAEAARWYRFSAEQGNAKAQRNLGYLYYVGKGVA